MTFIPIYTFFSIRKSSVNIKMLHVGQERRSLPTKIYYFLQKKIKYCCWQRDDCLTVSSVRQLEHIAESITLVSVCVRQKTSSAFVLLGGRRKIL